MRKITAAAVIVLLLGIVCLQILSALNIFPKCGWVKVCPVDAITMNKGKAVIDATKCIGCRRCVAGSGAPYRSTAAAPLPVTAVGAKEQAIVPVQKPVAKIAAETAVKSAPAVTVAQTATPAPATKKKGTYKTDPAVCIGCGLCTIYCPAQAITMVGDKAVIDPDKCTNCGICKNGTGEEFRGCPVGAISGP